MEGGHERMPLSSGTCPLCQESIDRKDIDVARPFTCPHCHAYLRTTSFFRFFKYGVCYGISALLIWRLQVAWLTGFVLWLALSFFAGFLYSLLLLMFFPAPRLVVCHNNDFQELDLNK
jgi:hypothetical protein